MLPSVSVQKVNANAGTVAPGSLGIAAIVAPASGGVKNAAAAYYRPQDVQTDYHEGPLVDWAAYDMDETNNPVLLIAPTTSTLGTYGAVLTSKTGTFVPVAGSAATLADDYDVRVVFPVGGVLGVAGITYQYSLDGGRLWSPVLALGTALTLDLAVPVTGADSGVNLTLGIATETVVAGDAFSVATVGPRMTSGDLIAALAVLYASKLPWDNLIVHGEVSAATFTDVDTWIKSLEGTAGGGRYRMAFMNTRFKQQVDGSHAAPAETEAAFATAMATLKGTLSTSIDIVLGTDGGALVSPITGLTKHAPASLYDIVRSESISVGVDPAEVDLGPVPNCGLDDVQSNPLFHDEQIFPGLDALGFTTLRSFFDRDGAFITNSNLFSSPGSDFTFSQYGRCMNLGCGIAFSMLTNLLSQGVRVNPKTGFILELQAAKWESMVQKAINKALDSQVSGSLFTISRSDDLSGNGPASLTCTFKLLGFKYVKKFLVTSEFVNSLP